MFFYCCSPICQFVDKAFVHLFICISMAQPTPKDTDRNFRRDALFLALSGVFITALVMANLMGTTKFVKLFTLHLPDWFLPLVPGMVRDGSFYSMIVPVGVIAFPATFLVTDLVSELFGRRKAQLLVWVGFGVNCFMLLVMTISYYLPDAVGVSKGLHLFEGVYGFMIGNTIASMIAYLTAQTIDVRLFHFWKKKTKGKHLWLRNNASTMTSQLVDTTAILGILYFAGNLGDSVTGIGALIILILNTYLFKLMAALIDTPLIYASVKLLRRYEEDPEGNSLFGPQPAAVPVYAENQEKAPRVYNPSSKDSGSLP
jgi:queuosine precursor transporter